MTMTDTLTALTGKPLGECTNGELYLSLLKLVNEKSARYRAGSCIISARNFSSVSCCRIT